MTFRPARSLFTGFACAMSVAACESSASSTASLALDTVLVLHNEGVGELPSAPSLAARLPDGSVLLASGMMTPYRLRFDGSTGRLLDSLAPTGPGPDEISGPLGALATRWDAAQTMLFDMGRGHIVWLDTTRTPLRSVLAAHYPHIIIPLANGSYATDGTAPPRGKMGYSIFVFDSLGAVTGTIGTFDSAAMMAPPPLVARDGAGGYWMVPRNGEYRVDRYDSTNTLVSTVLPNADWYPAYDASQYSPIDSVNAPRPFIQGILARDSTTLWIVGGVASEEWRAAVLPPKPAGPEGPGMPQISSFDRLLDGIVEAVDGVDGGRIASLRTDDLLQPLSGDTLLAMREDSLGFWHVALVRARVVRR